jgi:hypothetical protein
VTDVDLATDETFPWLGADRERVRTACPSCGSMVENTPRSFCAHWTTSSSCRGPPKRRPRGLTDTSRREWRALRAAVRAADSFTELLGESAPADAGSDPRVGRFLAAVSGDGTGAFPWLSYPDRGWEVPCPACGLAVFNERDAFVAHWTDNADCDGPMAVPARVWRARGLSVTAADLGQPPASDSEGGTDADSDEDEGGKGNGSGSEDANGDAPGGGGPTDSTGHSRSNAPASTGGAGDGDSDDSDDSDDADGDDWYGYNPHGNC